MQGYQKRRRHGVRCIAARGMREPVSRLPEFVLPCGHSAGWMPFSSTSPSQGRQAPEVPSVIQSASSKAFVQFYTTASRRPGLLVTGIEAAGMAEGVLYIVCE